MGSIHEHRSRVYTVPPEGSRRSFLSAVHETSPAAPPKPRLLDRVRTALRARHYSPRTEEAYVAWIRRYILKSISLCTSSLSARNHESAVITGITTRTATTHSAVL